MAVTAAYLHLPFCRRRCYYCDFAISVVGDRPLTDDANIVTDYTNYLCQEIRTTPRTDIPLQTIFFGGGTPSLLPVKQFAQIIQTLQQQFEIAPDAEISMEIDPNTFTQGQLQGYLDCGVNRVSLGIQTFEEKLLQLCGRTHTVKDIFQAIESIHRLSIKNFSLDLMTGLPHQTLEQCHASLATAVDFKPSHLSCYDLVLEPVTVFGKQYQPGETPLPTDETTAAMYRLTQQFLTSNGYQHYEISNYAQPGDQCRHNRVYWQNQPYYGFGMGATSYVNEQRYTRPRTRREYYNWVQKGAVIDVPLTSKSDRLLETLMLGLRLAEGVNLATISQQFGSKNTTKILTCLQQYQERNWVIVELESRLRLNDPEGFLFSNQILTSLFEIDFD
ncbi:MAG TPA: radical SAM family heme chaperone HemW [Xenococcaceae cyanobacterium]